MQNERDLGKRLELLEKEMSTLTDEVINLKRGHRADLDSVRLELETIKLFVAERYPDFEARFAAVSDKAVHEIEPE